MLQVKRVSQVTFLHSEKLGRIPRIVHAFSTRQGERNDFLAAVGVPGWPVMKLKQVHSGIVCEMHDTTAANDPVEGDAAVTALAGVVLAIQTADCVPILLADFQLRAVAAIHAGWRGTQKKILENALKLMKSNWNSQTRDIRVVIGPGLKSCCYQVGEEFLNYFTGENEVKMHNGQFYLDLVQANKNQMRKEGMRDIQIYDCNFCTFCNPNFFSYRRDKEKAGRMISVMMLRG